MLSINRLAGPPPRVNPRRSRYNTDVEGSDLPHVLRGEEPPLLSTTGGLGERVRVGGLRRGEVHS